MPLPHLLCGSSGPATLNRGWGGHVVFKASLGESNTTKAETLSVLPRAMASLTSWFASACALAVSASATSCHSCHGSGWWDGRERMGGVARGVSTSIMVIQTGGCRVLEAGSCPSAA